MVLARAVPVCVELGEPVEALEREPVWDVEGESVGLLEGGGVRVLDSELCALDGVTVNALLWLDEGVPLCGDEELPIALLVPLDVGVMLLVALDVGVMLLVALDVGVMLLVALDVGVMLAEEGGIDSDTAVAGALTAAVEDCVNASVAAELLVEASEALLLGASLAEAVGVAVLGVDAELVVVSAPVDEPDAEAMKETLDANDAGDVAEMLALPLQELDSLASDVKAATAKTSAHKCVNDGGRRMVEVRGGRWRRQQPASERPSRFLHQHGGRVYV